MATLFDFAGDPIGSTSTSIVFFTVGAVAIILTIFLLIKFLGGNDEDDEPEDDEDDDAETCSNCGKKLTSDDNDGDGWNCEACDEEPLCDDCCVGLGEDDEGTSNLTVCKECIDEAYPRKIETKIEYKEKIVEKPVIVDKEGVPVSKTFNPVDKRKFD